MGNAVKISLLHIIFISMTAIGLKNHVTILPPILESAKRDGWISVLLASILMFLWLLWMLYIQKKTELKPIKVWLRDKIGTVGTYIILFSTIVYLYFLATFALRETILWISYTFLTNTPLILLTILYIVLCFLLISTNIQTFVIVNTIILAFVVVFGFYASFANIPVKNYELLLPILEDGFQPVLKSIIYPASGFIEIFLLIFLQHHFKQPMKWYHIGIITFILLGLTLGPLISAIAEFGPDEAAKQRYPAYEEWTLVSIGRYIEHMDFLSVYQWLSGTFIRVGIILFIVCDILNFTGQPKKIWLYMMPPFLFLNLGFSLIEDNTFFKLNNYYFLIISFIFIFFLSILLTFIGKVSKRTKVRRFNRQENNNNESSDNEWTQ